MPKITSPSRQSTKSKNPAGRKKVLGALILLAAITWVAYIPSLDNGFTNHATVPTNRLITSYSVGFSVETPAVPATGQKLVNRQPYSIEVNVTAAGQVKGWTKTDANGTAVDFAGSFFAGQSFVLDPGDSVTLDYDQPPQWRWKALR